MFYPNIVKNLSQAETGNAFCTFHSTPSVRLKPAIPIPMQTPKHMTDFFKVVTHIICTHSIIRKHHKYIYKNFRSSRSGGVIAQSPCPSHGVAYLECPAGRIAVQKGKWSI
ncbi:unnamed protein product [Kuraishia capsulata CBS 1993]|uniref:Uncharacterized protein n=1 Tax=Kuraishia capsulata CBS 1993 TaxID=1382522 RepID=W6MXH8_9ASCO|nr:uncharacterized protein KUCA_T00004900001 [Kuraishia capsulata CBS 1993]CDK28915.1 unnamed protein product [Kuraishia capsulata CBS 1993]